MHAPHPRRHARAGFVTALLLASALACSGDGSSAEGPLDPHALAARYVIDSAFGQAVPARIDVFTDSASGQPIETFVDSDTISVDSATGRYVQRAHLRTTLQGVVLARQVWADHGVFTRAGDSLHFDSNYIENVAFHGALGADGRLRIAQELGTETGAGPFVLRPLR